MDGGVGIRVEVLGFELAEADWNLRFGSSRIPGRLVEAQVRTKVS